MFGLILGVLILIAGVVAAFVQWKAKEGYPGPTLIVAIVLALVFIGFASFTTIPTGHTGIVTSFGRVENYTLDSGVHLIAPWKSVIEMDNREQRVQFNM